MDASKNNYSVIVLLDEEHRDFINHIQNLIYLFRQRKDPFEIIIVANGISGFLKERLINLQKGNYVLKAFEFSRRTTPAVCIKAALCETMGNVVVATGPYQQITNESFDILLDSLDDEIDIICPWRQKRVDPALNRIQSKLFNYLARLFVRTDIHDLSCTVKIFRRRVFEETEFYGNMYRFLPVVAERKGFKLIEVKCDHHEERGKTGFYSLSEYITRMLDILTLYFNVRFSKKPLRFFSTIGLSFLIIGLIISVYLFFERFIFGQPLGNRPFLLIGILFMVLGVQISSVGLLGEIIAFIHGRHKKDYAIEKIIK